MTNNPPNIREDNVAALKSAMAASISEMLETGEDTHPHMVTIQGEPSSDELVEAVMSATAEAKASHKQCSCFR